MDSPSTVANKCVYKKMINIALGSYRPTHAKLKPWTSTGGSASLKSRGRAGYLCTYCGPGT